MMAKYSIEYSPQFKQRTAQTSLYSGDDPVACEEFLTELLERGYRIQAIRHDGLDMTRPEFDKMIKTGASARPSASPRKRSITGSASRREA